MKHQISKVALIATLAFIGVGFAGTQQAKAVDCPPGDCDFSGNNFSNCGATAEQIEDGYSIPVVVRINVPVSTDDKGCIDCNGDCRHDERIYVDTYFYNCQVANANGDSLTEYRYDPVDKVMGNYPVLNGDVLTKHVTSEGYCENDDLDGDSTRIASSTKKLNFS